MPGYKFERLPKEIGAASTIRELERRRATVAGQPPIGARLAAGSLEGLMSEGDRDVGLVLIFPNDPDFSDEEPHEAITQLERRHPGDMDMIIVWLREGERIRWNGPGVDGSADLYADARLTLEPLGVRVFRR